MASNRKRRTIIEETLPPTNDAETSGNDDIADLLIVMSKVYKINGPSKSFCTQTTEPVDELFLQSNFPAGGKYIVEEYNNMNQLVSKPVYEIEPKAVAVHANGNGNGNGMSPHDVQIRMLFDELTFTRQLLMQQLANNGNKGGTITEMISGLAGLHALAPGGKDPVDLIIKGMELGMKSNGGGKTDWTDKLMDTVKEIAPTAIQAISLANQPKDGNGQPMLPAATTPQSRIKQAMAWLKSNIITGLDTDLAVAWVIRNANSNDEQCRELLATAVQGSVDNFIAIDPEIANEPYRAWFTKAITEIKEWR